MRIGQVHETGPAVQRQPSAHHIDGRQFRFCVARRNVDDQALNLTINDAVQRLLNHLVVRRYYHLSAGALLEEVASVIESVLFAFNLTGKRLLLSSRHPPSSPAVRICIPLCSW